MAQLKLKGSLLIPQFDGKPESFNKWRVEFKSYLHLKRISHLLQLPAEPKEVKMKLPNEPREFGTESEAIEEEKSQQEAIKKWKEESADLYAILQLALDDKTKTDVANTLAFKMNGPKAWSVIKQQFKSRSILRLIELEDELANTRMAETEDPRKFISKLMNIVRAIEGIEKRKMEEEKIVTMILRKLPKTFGPFIMAQMTNPAKDVMQLTEQLQHTAKGMENTGSPYQEEMHYAKTNYNSKPVHHQTTQYRSTGATQSQKALHRFPGKCYFCHTEGHKKFECNKRKEEIAKLDSLFSKITVNTNPSPNYSSKSTKTRSSVQTPRHKPPPTSAPPCERQTELKSEQEVNDDWVLNPSLARRLFQAFKITPTVDLCATNYSSKAPNFFSKSQNSLTVTWRPNEVYYLNPPFHQMADYLKKASNDQIEGMIIFPIWKKTQWFQGLIKSIVSPVIVLPNLEQGTFHNPTQTRKPSHLPMWKAGAAIFNFKNEERKSRTLGTQESIIYNEKLSQEVKHPCYDLLTIEEKANYAQERSKLLLDSGSTSTVVNSRKLLNSTTQQLTSPIPICLANGTLLQAHERGTCDLERGGVKISLENALLIPESTRNLISVAKLVDEGHQVTFKREGSTIETKNGDLFPVDREGNLFVINTIPCHDQETMEEANTLHERLGHPGRKKTNTLNKIITSSQLGFSKDCITCIATKTKRAPFQRLPEERKEQTFNHRVYTDCSGRFNTPGLNGEVCFQVVVDGFSSAVSVTPLRSEGDCATGLKNYVSTFGKPDILRSDNAASFLVNSNFGGECRKLGIKQEFTIPYSSQQNGKAERMVGEITKVARGLLHQRNTPIRFWPYAVTCAAHILNNTPNTKTANSTPNQLAQVTEKDVEEEIQHLRTFGCKCFIHTRKEDRPYKKLDKTSEEGVFVGYPRNRHGYLVYRLRDKKVKATRDVTFLEDVPGFPAYSSEAPSTTTDKPHPSQNPTIITTQTSHHSPSSSLAMNEDSPVETATPAHHEHQEATVTNPETQNFPQLHSPPTAPQVRRSARIAARQKPNEAIADSIPDASVTTATPTPQPHQNQTPFQSTQRDIYVQEIELRGPGEISEAPVLEEPEELELNLTEDPISVQQAMTGEDFSQWKTAMDNELESLTTNETFEEATIPYNSKKLVSTKWVFKKKTDEHGALLKYKARLVAKGYSQRKGIDYHQTFSPVTRLSTIRILCAIAAAKGYKLKRLDVKTAFLNAPIDEEIFISIPKGYIKKDPNTNCLRLKKALYGLKQAGREWNQLITSFLINSGDWKQCESEPCLFKRVRNTTGKMYAAIFVDDFTAAVENEGDWKKFVEELSQQFEISENEDLKWVLGIQIHQQNGVVTMNQATYINSMLEDFNMEDSNPSLTPMTKDRLDQDTASHTKKPDETIPYQNLVGALQHAVRSTRPDINFATNFASTKNKSYTSTDWKAAKRILSYLKGTKEAAISYGIKKELILTGYVDADWAGDKLDRKSTSGYVFTLAGGAISWKSKKQNCVALSTCEAEYMAMTEASQEATYLRRILEFLDSPQTLPTSIYIDNRAAVFLANNPGLHQRAKHIAIRYHYNREVIKNGIVTLKPIPSTDNPADAFTKPLPNPKLHQLMHTIGVTTLQNSSIG